MYTTGRVCESVRMSVLVRLRVSGMIRVIRAGRVRLGVGMDHGRIDGSGYARMGRVLLDDIYVWGRRGRGL